MAQSQRVNSCRLADYKYVKDRAVAVYQQNTAPVQAQAAALRDATPGRYSKYDLDMGFQFASIPKILWLEIQRRGITENTPAIVRFLQQHESLTGENYFTTTKRLL